MIMGINQAYLDVHGLEIAEGRNLMACRLFKRCESGSCH